MSQDIVRVLVIGTANTGKTTIAHIIKTALDEHGFKNVSIHDDDKETEGKEHISKRIETTRNRPVRVEVVRVSKGAAGAMVDEHDPIGVVTGRLSSTKP